MFSSCTTSDNNSKCESVVKEVWGHWPFEWLALPSRGSSGGILLIGDKDRIEVLEHEIETFSISIRCRLKSMLVELVFVGVYDPTQRDEVIHFLGEGTG